MSFLFTCAGTSLLSECLCRLMLHENCTGQRLGSSLPLGRHLQCSDSHGACLRARIVGPFAHSSPQSMILRGRVLVPSLFRHHELLRFQPPLGPQVQHKDKCQVQHKCSTSAAQVQHKCNTSAQDRSITATQRLLIRCAPSEKCEETMASWSGHDLTDSTNPMTVRVGMGWSTRSTRG